MTRLFQILLVGLCFLAATAHAGDYLLHEAADSDNYRNIPESKCFCLREVRGVQA